MFKCMKLRNVAAVALVVGAGGVLLASSLTASAANDYPTPIQQALDSGVEIVRTFPAASGLTGWVLSQGGQYSIVYTTEDEKTVVIGTLIGEGGENLSAAYEDQYIPKPDMDAMFGELEQSAYVVEGTVSNPKSTVYVFVDANCPFCHYAWKALQAYEKVGLQVRWIPVATLGPTSMPKAIAVLAATDKTAAFRQMEQNHGKPWDEPPGVSAEDQPEIAAKIAKNGELMGAFGIGGTPGIVWKDKDGEVQVKGGMPRLSEIPVITGLPEQNIEDPELARFR